MKQAFWLLIIAFSGSALFGGFLSGRAAVPHFPRKAAAPTPVTPAPPDVQIPQTDERARDAFAQDDAVAIESGAADVRASARLALLLVDGGHSPALEAPFLSLGVPVTFVIDPSGAAARQVLELCTQSGMHAYLQANVPIAPSEIAMLHASYPRAAGIAARMTGDDTVSAGALAALRRYGWGLLNEYGANEALARRVANAGVRYAARSITVDDHVQKTYVAYMLHQAVRIARGRTATVLARPFPATLRGVKMLLAHSAHDGIRFVELP